MTWVCFVCRAGEREDAPAGVRRRVRLRGPTGASMDAGDQARGRDVLRGADQRNHRVRGSRRVGVGECACPRDRLRSYIQAARLGIYSPASSSKCGVHRHFVRTPHSIADLEITLVQSLPPTTGANICDAVRARNESRWIQRLEASLNIRRQFWASFPGHYKKRRTARARRPASPQIDAEYIAFFLPAWCT